MHKYPIVRLPDDEPYRWWKLFPDTIVIHYGEALDTFLLLGDEKALLIDTAYGRGDFPNIVEELRDVLDSLHDVRPRADDRRDKDLQRVDPLGEEDHQTEQSLSVCSDPSLPPPMRRSNIPRPSKCFVKKHPVDPQPLERGVIAPK